MTIDGDMIDRLAEFPIFRGFTPEQCRRVGPISSIVEFEPGDYVLRQGHRSRNLWVVLEGTCEVIREAASTEEDGPAIVLSELGPRFHFGEMSFFHAAPHSASVRAKSHLRLLRIARVDYDRLIGEDSRAAYKLAYNTIEALAERLRRMDQRVADLTAGSRAVEQASEWSSFRGKMFDSWNL